MGWAGPRPIILKIDGPVHQRRPKVRPENIHPLYNSDTLSITPPEYNTPCDKFCRGPIFITGGVYTVAYGSHEAFPCCKEPAIPLARLLSCNGSHLGPHPNNQLGVFRGPLGGIERFEIVK